MTTQEKIMSVAVQEVQEKGVSFTMSNLAAGSGISKKTLYEVFDTKEAVILKLITQSHRSIKAQQARLYDDTTLSAVEKIKRILTVVPEFHFAFDYTFLGDLKKKYPAVYEKVDALLNSDWDRTFELMNEAVEKKQIKRVNKLLFKEMYCSTVMAVYDTSLLSNMSMSYAQTLEEVVSIMIDGISL